MELSGDHIIGKRCGQCNRNTLLLFEYEWTSVSCNYNVIKRKQELSKIQRKKFFINCFKYAEVKISCICVDVYKNYEGNVFDKIYEVLSKLKNKKLRINIFLIEN